MISAKETNEIRRKALETKKALIEKELSPMLENIEQAIKEAALEGKTNTELHLFIKEKDVYPLFAILIGKGYMITNSFYENTSNALDLTNIHFYDISKFYTVTLKSYNILEQQQELHIEFKLWWL